MRAHRIGRAAGHRAGSYSDAEIRAKIAVLKELSAGGMEAGLSVSQIKDLLRYGVVGDQAQALDEDEAGLEEPLDDANAPDRVDNYLEIESNKGRREILIRQYVRLRQAGLGVEPADIIRHSQQGSDVAGVSAYDLSQVYRRANYVFDPLPRGAGNGFRRLQEEGDAAYFRKLERPQKIAYLKAIMRRILAAGIEPTEEGIAQVNVFSQAFYGLHPGELRDLPARAKKLFAPTRGASAGLEALNEIAKGKDRKPEALPPIPDATAGLLPASFAQLDATRSASAAVAAAPASALKPPLPVTPPVAARRARSASPDSTTAGPAPLAAAPTMAEAEVAPAADVTASADETAPIPYQRRPRPGALGSRIARGASAIFGSMGASPNLREVAQKLLQKGVVPSDLPAIEYRVPGQMEESRIFLERRRAYFALARYRQGIVDQVDLKAFSKLSETQKRGLRAELIELQRARDEQTADVEPVAVAEAATEPIAETAVDISTKTDHDKDAASVFFADRLAELELENSSRVIALQEQVAAFGGFSDDTRHGLASTIEVVGADIQYQITRIFDEAEQTGAPEMERLIADIAEEMTRRLADLERQVARAQARAERQVQLVSIEAQRRERASAIASLSELEPSLIEPNRPYAYPTAQGPGASISEVIFSDAVASYLAADEDKQPKKFIDAILKGFTMRAKNAGIVRLGAIENAVEIRIMGDNTSDLLLGCYKRGVLHLIFQGTKGKTNQAQLARLAYLCK
jgi:hypothetical protein